MLQTVILALALAVSGAALAQQKPEPDPKRESAAAGASSARCDMMSREEMLMCQVTKPDDATGVRSSLCDTVAASTIERCLQQQESVSSDPANEFRDRRTAQSGSG